MPTLFLIGQDGTIETSCVGWVKQEVEEVSAKLASAQQSAPRPLFKAGDAVRDFRAG